MLKGAKQSKIKTASLAIFTIIFTFFVLFVTRDRSLEKSDPMPERYPLLDLMGRRVPGFLLLQSWYANRLGGALRQDW